MPFATKFYLSQQKFTLAALGLLSTFCMSGCPLAMLIRCFQLVEEATWGDRQHAKYKAKKAFLSGACNTRIQIVNAVRQYNFTA